jgi:hypothetical protein
MSYLAFSIPLFPRLSLSIVHIFRLKDEIKPFLNPQSDARVNAAKQGEFR